MQQDDNQAAGSANADHVEPEDQLIDRWNARCAMRVSASAGSWMMQQTDTLWGIGAIHAGGNCMIIFAIFASLALP